MNVKVLVYFSRALKCSYPILEGLFCNMDDFYLEGYAFKGNVWSTDILFNRISETTRFTLLISSLQNSRIDQLRFILGKMSEKDFESFKQSYVVNWIMAGVIRKGFIDVCKVVNEYNSLYPARLGAATSAQFNQVEILRVFIEKDPSCWMDCMNQGLVNNSNQCIEFLVKRFADKLTVESSSHNIKSILERSDCLKYST